MRFLCNSVVYRKFPTFPQATALQLLQIELLVRGWKGMSALTKWLDAPSQFPNYVLSSGLRPQTRKLYQNRRAEIKRDGSLQSIRE